MMLSEGPRKKMQCDFASARGATSKITLFPSAESVKSTPGSCGTPSRTSKSCEVSVAICWTLLISSKTKVVVLPSKVQGLIFAIRTVAAANFDAGTRISKLTICPAVAGVVKVTVEAPAATVKSLVGVFRTPLT